MQDNGNPFKPGDVVNIAIEGAVFEKNSEGRTFIRVDRSTGISDSGVYVSFPNGDPAVTIEHAIPAQWPPQPGDLWRDNGDELWFAVSDGDVLLIPSYPIPNSRTGREPQRVLKTVGPLTLVHREDQS